MESITQFIYWVLWLLLIAISIYHSRVKSMTLITPQLLILMIRMLLGIIDLDKKRKDMEGYEIVVYILF